MAKRCSVCENPIIGESDDVCTQCGKFGNVTVCDNGHKVCNGCMDEIAFDRIHRICMESTSANPYEVFMRIIDDGSLRFHDFKHHVAVGSALLAAHRNAGMNIDLDFMLTEMCKRGRRVPPGSCGLMGNCGAAVSVGTFLSILTNTTPYSEDTWGDVNLATAQCLIQLALIGGPRCCKRNSFIALKVGARIASEKFGSEMEIPEDIVCQMHDSNTECIGERCPFYKG